MEINEEANNISQGQKQLLDHRAGHHSGGYDRFMILDEATSSVDTQNGSPHPEGYGQH